MTNLNMPIILQNFLDLESNIDIENLKILNEIFEKVDHYEIKSTNVLMDGLIIDGLVMNPKQKIKLDNLKKSESEFILKAMNKKINDIKEAYFYNTFIKFVNKFNYIDLEEQVILNFLFEEIKEENKNLQEVNNGDKKYIIK